MRYMIHFRWGSLPVAISPKCKNIICFSIWPALFPIYGAAPSFVGGDVNAITRAFYPHFTGCLLLLHFSSDYPIMQVTFSEWV